MPYAHTVLEILESNVLLLLLRFSAPSIQAVGAAGWGKPRLLLSIKKLFLELQDEGSYYRYILS